MIPLRRGHRLPAAIKQIAALLCKTPTEILEPADRPLRRIITVGLALAHAVEVIEKEDRQPGQLASRLCQILDGVAYHRRHCFELLQQHRLLLRRRRNVRVRYAPELVQVGQGVARPRLHCPVLEDDVIHLRPDQQIVHLLWDRPGGCVDVEKALAEFVELRPLFRDRMETQVRYAVVRRRPGNLDYLLVHIDQRCIAVLCECTGAARKQERRQK